MLRFLGVILAILFSFVACSRGGDPLVPSVESNAPSDGPSVSMVSGGSGAPNSESAGADVWGVVDIQWDPVTGELSVLDERSAQVELRHYKVSYFLTSPQCDDCITIAGVDSDTSLGTVEAVVSLRNPTGLCGYDVRGVLRIADGVELRLLNADGYTSLFEAPGFQHPTPFRMFARNQDHHAFGPGAIHSEAFELKTVPGGAPVRFTYLVTAGHPAPAGDVSRIGGFRQLGQFLPSGGTATVSFEIEDLQNDIDGVCLHTGPLGAGDVWLLSSGDRWEAVVQNLSAASGLYELQVEAHSTNAQGAVTSHLYKAVVFQDLAALRSELLNLMNGDRAAEGLSALTIDQCLNTVAQSHAQDMADRKYFSHTNLDGWSPWSRMEYYGVDFRTAGENIAVGQDTPGEVETAWMNSAGHRANILNSSFHEVGLGIVSVQAGDPYAPGYYWVQLFTN